MNDAEVMAWLDRLLDLEPGERSATLERLSEDRPELHARLIRLLHAALMEETTQMLARAMREGISVVLRARGAGALQPKQSVHGYRLLRELGRGGIAAVWLAECVDDLAEGPVAVSGQPFIALEYNHGIQVSEDRGRAALDVPRGLRLLLQVLPTPTHSKGD